MYRVGALMGGRIVNTKLQRNEDFQKDFMTETHQNI